MKKIVIVLLMSIPHDLLPHELFSLRAEIARAGGFNFDGLFHHSKQGHQKESDLLVSLMYGFTEFITGELRVPIRFENVVYEPGTRRTFKGAGLDKIHALGRFRVYKKYEHAKRIQILVIPGIFLPTASDKTTPQEKMPIIANRSIDFLLGTVGALETLKWYHFAGLVYRANTRAKHFSQGDQFFYSYAIGYRPIPPITNKPDWVFLWEVDGVWTDKNHYNGMKNNNSGSNVIFTGPAVFYSLDNVLLKADAQFPMIEHVNGKQDSFNWRGAFGIYVQF